MKKPQARDAKIQKKRENDRLGGCGRGDGGDGGDSGGSDGGGCEGGGARRGRGRRRRRGGKGGLFG